MLRKCLVSAPSNIALIKYMGKENSSLNLPANSSLSMTLNHLRTWVEIDCDSDPSKSIHWRSEMPLFSGSSENVLPPAVPNLSAAGVTRILNHVRRVQDSVFKIFPAFDLVPVRRSSFEIKTANTFPAASGIASSASSFAGVTLATALVSSEDSDAFKAVWDSKKGPQLREELAAVSRQGSGSSCRSFEGPWVLWEGATAGQVESSLPQMTDLVVLVSSDSKEVSSSQAHEWVQSSPLWQGRVGRVDARIHELQGALQSGDLGQISKLVWAEMWEMHSLFHTCNTPFTYFQPDTIRVLKWLSKKLELPSPPIVTLDAGPNIHMIVEASKANEWKAALSLEFPDLKILQDTQGRGASWNSYER